MDHIESVYRVNTDNWPFPYLSYQVQVLHLQFWFLCQQWTKQLVVAWQLRNLLFEMESVKLCGELIIKV